MKMEKCVLMRAASDKYGVSAFVFNEWEKVLQEHFDGVLPVDEAGISCSEGYDTQKVEEMLERAGTDWLFIIGDEEACRKTVKLNTDLKGTKFKIGFLNVMAEEDIRDMHSLLYMCIEENVRHQMYPLVKTRLEDKDCSTKMLLLELPNFTRDQLTADMMVSIQSKYKLNSFQPTIITLMNSIQAKEEDLQSKFQEVGTGNVLVLAGKNNPLIGEVIKLSECIEKYDLTPEVDLSEGSSYSRFLKTWIQNAARRLEKQSRSFVITQMVPYLCTFPYFQPLDVLEKAIHAEYRFHVHPSFEKSLEMMTPGMKL